MERRLAAILAGDAVAYSRLMSNDEAGTHSSLQAHLSGVVFPSVSRHHGRIVKLMGDGFLAEFSSVVEAVDCAAEIQRDMGARNSGDSDNRIQFRIGVHLGDIIIENEDIFGDGVNIAARLEGIADPGGGAFLAKRTIKSRRSLRSPIKASDPRISRTSPILWKYSSLEVTASRSRMTDKKFDIAERRMAFGLPLRLVARGRLW